MAITKLTVGAAKSARPIASSVSLDLKLATDVSVPPNSLKSYSIMLYGAKKIGKTTLCAEFPNPYFLCTEVGTKALRVKKSDCPDWDHFAGYVDLLVKAADPTRTVIVDIVDKAYDFIYDKTCRALGIDSPTEEKDFGATWKKIKRTFGEKIEALCTLPGGVIFVSHETEKEIEVQRGEVIEKIDRVQPTMGKQALNEVEGVVDVIAYYGYQEDKRVIRFDGSQTLVAGCRLKDNFFVKGKPGTRVVRIPMGNSSTEAYGNLMRAFDNQQTSSNGETPVAAATSRPLQLRL
jgi:hypothetical protein